MDQTFCPVLAAMSRSKKTRSLFLRKILQEEYPDAVCALDFAGSPFRLLVMARLSAQCTDQRVNEVSRDLFRRFPDIRSFADADLNELEKAIRPCGLFRSKARQIRDMSQILSDQYRGEVPRTKKELMALPGVGEKIANLMLGDVFDDPHIVADTHCIRLSLRFGLTESRDPSRVTRDLERIIPKEEQSDFCHRIILLGREFCRARSPRCSDCPLMKRFGNMS